MNRGHELVLLAEDDSIGREYLEEALTDLGARVEVAVDGEEACRRLEDKKRAQPDIVVTDLQMPKRDGLAVLDAAKRMDAARPVVLVTAHGTMDVAIQAMRRGADDILVKPVSVDELELALMRLRDRVRLRRENAFLRERSVGEGMLVVSEPMQALLEVVRRVAPSVATVLIHGESGVGKERVAAQVHRLSDRASGPFVTVNCAAIPESLMESEFFGHEAGAFTGATKRKPGSFEMADGGTLFLDEVGEMDLALQAKLLRALQEGEITRVGGTRTLRVDVRVVAATNRDLRGAVREGRFREDLLYRLEVVPVVVPPLRNRAADIVPLAERFLAGRVELSDEAKVVLERYDWPGNVRELSNVMQRAVLMTRGRTVSATDLSTWLQPRSMPAPQAALAGRERPGLAGQSLATLERRAILETLNACAGNRTRAAAQLGIGVRTLFNKLRAYDAEGSV